MIKLFSDIFKKSFTRSFDMRLLMSALKKKEREARIVVNEDVSKDEFLHRYNMVRMTAIIALFFVSASFLVMLFSANMQQFVFCLLSIFLLFLFYLRYAMILWISRCCWKNWDKRMNKVFVYGGTYFNAVMANPLELLPLKLTRGESCPDA